MPKIPEFDAPALQLRPNDMAADAWAAGARRIGSYYGQKAEAQRSSGASMVRTVCRPS
jgi:hypothetical protein